MRSSCSRLVRVVSVCIAVMFVVRCCDPGALGLSLLLFVAALCHLLFLVVLFVLYV